MHSIQFWRSWPIAHQRLLGVFSGFLVITLVFLWMSDFRTPAPVITQDHYQQLESQDLSLPGFQLGTFSLHVSAEAYLVFERVLGSPLQPNREASCFFLGLLVTAMILLLAVISQLSRMWFTVGMGFFILVVLSLRIEALQCLGLTNKIPTLIVLLFFGAASYYFQYIKPSTGFVARLIVFLCIALVTAVGLALLSRVREPFYTLSANGIIAAVVLSVVFIFMVAHEVMASFILIVSKGMKQTKSLRHFLIISTIYLVNLGFIYADKKHLITWNFLSFNLFLLLTLSGVLGIWGFRQRESQYTSIMGANPYGVFVFLALATICFGTTGYFLATANDPLVQFLQDCILYGHLGYGIIFMIYIISNFISMLADNLQVYKVLYKPTVMPYFTFRLMGLIATFAFFAYSNWKVSLNQVYAGYYNSQGDIAIAQDTLQLAEGYYQRSVLYATRNYHAHYALAQIANYRFQPEKEKIEYQKLADGRPLDLAYLNFSEAYERNHSFLEAALVLEQGLKDFPDNGLLQNALSLSFMRLTLNDSALVVARAAARSATSRPEAETNIAGLTVKFQPSFPVDSLLQLLRSDHPGIKSNALALASLQGKVIDADPDPKTDTLLTIYSATVLNNYIVNHREQTDSVLLSKAVKLARLSGNAYFKNILFAASAQAYYSKGEISRALVLLKEIAFSSKQGKYYNTLGLWALEQGVPENATIFFDEAISQNYAPAFFHKTISQTEEGNLKYALEGWDSLHHSNDADKKDLAEKMTRLLTAPVQKAIFFSDEEKYEYSRHRFPLDAEDGFVKFTETFNNQELKARAIIDRTKKLDEADEPQQALETLLRTTGLQLTNKKLYEEIIHLRMRLLGRLEQWPLLESQLKSDITFDGVYVLDKLYLEALLSVKAGKKTAASEKFKILAGANPYFEDAVIAAFYFLSSENKDKLKMYSILVNALDLNPNSVKLLKAYVIQSAQLGFDEYAESALEKLHTVLTTEGFIKFAKENPQIFEVSAN